MTRAVVIAVLVLAVVASAVTLVRTHHERRSLLARLDEADAARDRLQVEWGKLQIEQSTWAVTDRIERVAAEKLDLHPPPPGETVLVTIERGD